MNAWLLSADFQIDRPLSVSAFQHWRWRLPSHVDQVTKASSSYLLTTTTGSADIREAAIRLQTSDMRPVEERLRFADGQEHEISEIDNPSPPERAEIVPPLTVPPSTPEVAAVPQPSSNDLADIEVEVRSRLDAQGLDTEREWTIVRTPTAVRLSGEAANRKELAFLRGLFVTLANIDLQIRAPEERMPNSLEAPLEAGTPPEQVSAPLQPLLERKIPSPAAREAFVAEALDAAQALLAEAAALKQLADRYTDSEIALLSPASQPKLEFLIRAYIESMQGKAPVFRSSFWISRESFRRQGRRVSYLARLRGEFVWTGSKSAGAGYLAAHVGGPLPSGKLQH